MSQLNSHKRPVALPPPNAILSTADLPLLKKLGDSYKTWHGTLPHINKLSRYTLGAKIDVLFLESVEFILLAGYAPRTQKLSILKRAGGKLDALKFFLQLAWEMKLLENTKYLPIATDLSECGKMLGGWQRQLQQTAPAQNEREC